MGEKVTEWIHRERTRKKGKPKQRWRDDIKDKAKVTYESNARQEEMEGLI